MSREKFSFRTSPGQVRESVFASCISVLANSLAPKKAQLLFDQGRYHEDLINEIEGLFYLRVFGFV